VAANAASVHARAEPKNKMLPAITMAIKTLRMVYLFDRNDTRLHSGRDAIE
jgi:hypothetical protein